MMNLVRLSILIAVICIGAFELGAQAVNTPFGKNRIQYHDDFNSWSRYETENMVTYWYGKAKNIAHTAIQISELEHDDIQELLEYRINEKIELLVYTDLSDYKQSNFGNEEIFNNTADQVKTVGNKIFIYFDGSHEHLRSQIRQGIASVYLTNILNGSSIQEVVQNALLLHMPDWFSEGLIVFADESWNADIHQTVKQHLSNDRNLNFEKYADRYPQAAGYSMWHFLESTYGRTKISQIIYITRIYRSLEGSFPYVLNESFDTIKEKWADYYINYYNLESVGPITYQGKEIVKTKKKHNEVITDLSISPDGSNLIYTVNTLGKQELMLYNFREGTSKRIFKNEKKNPFQSADTNFPIVTWTPGGNAIYVLYEKKDVKYLRYIYLKEPKEYEEEDIPENYQRIYSMDYVDGNRLLFSGSFDGLSDLFYYKPKSRSTKRITEDLWDDLDAEYVSHNGRSGILFRSNRESLTLKKEKLDTILPLGAFDFYFLEDGEEKEVIKLTNTPDIDVRNGGFTSDGKFVYLQLKDLQYRRVAKDFLGSSAPVFNSPTAFTIEKQDISDSGDYVYIVEDADTYRIYSIPNIDLSQDNSGPATYSNTELNQNGEGDDLKEQPLDTKNYDDGKLFQSRWSDIEGTTRTLEEEGLEEDNNEEDFGQYYNNYYSGAETADGKKIIKFEPYRASAQRITFRLFDYSLKIDNQPLFEGLEAFTPISQQLTANPNTLHFQAKVVDLFEDYKLTGGFRIPTSFNGSEVYLTFFDDKRRWDKEYTLYRRLQSEVIPDTGAFERFKQHTIMGIAKWKYPLSIFRSIRLSSTLRLDRSFFAITEVNRLNEPFDFAKRLSARAEYVYDNSFDLLTNIKNGTRYKFFVEAINEFELDNDNGFNFDPHTSFTGIVGFDARHYIPVLRKMVLAMRAAGSKSFGSKSMLYYLGGMENWVLPEFNEATNIPESINYAYSAIAPPLRGFDHNARNGGSYLISNVEFRVPVFAALLGNNIRNGFIRNFQVIGFADAGLAWHGFLPNSRVNPLNEDTIVTTDSSDDNILLLNITYFRDPIAFGYGWGVRSSLLGYYVKFDYAYGIETGTRLAPKWYVSLGYDF